MALDLVDRARVDHRPNLRRRLALRSDPESVHAFCELFNEEHRARRMHEDAVGQTQVCPPLRNFAAIKPSTAASISASSKTMKGALPPSSSDIFLIVSAPRALGACRPVSSR